jgi:hypothetical protein
MISHDIIPMDDWGDMEDMEDSDDDESSEGDVLDGWGDSEEESDDDDDDEVKVEIVEKFISTFHKGDYDAEFDNALSSNQTLPPTLMPTQASYIKPDNWRERNRDGLDGVKEQLQDCITSAMRDKRFDLCLNHIDGDHPIVWHEPILDQYWDQLNAGKVRYFCNIQFVNVEIKKERLAALLAIFRNGSATNSSIYVTFDNANLCEEGIVLLSELVDHSSELQHFYLCRNLVDNMDSASCLSRSLKLHDSITDLFLTHCDLGSSPEILLIILQSDIRYINLSHNNIDSVGGVKIAEYLEGNPPIQSITIDHNQLNDDDAILISQALKRNTNLKTIDIHSNIITSIGVKALLTCVFDSSSLNAISESNHILVSMNIFNTANIVSQKLNGYVRTLLKLGKRDKIFLALQDKDSLLKYLANVPVELIPEVLAFRQRVVDQQVQRQLNIVYSTMRWWNMPMLYLYRSCVKSDTKRKRDN